DLRTRDLVMRRDGAIVEQPNHATDLRLEDTKSGAAACTEGFRGQQSQVHEHHVQRRAQIMGNNCEIHVDDLLGGWPTSYRGALRPPTGRSDRLRWKNCEARVTGILPSRSCQLSQFCHESSCPTMPAVEDAVANHHIVSFSAAAAAIAPTATVNVADLESPEPADGIIGQSPVLNEVLQRVRRVAPTDMPVLITGETGTGQELLARAIHRRSRRAARHLVSVNLAAVPDALAAAELFGHERGAFTGADRMRVGRFEAADRGTLFLDEIGELRADQQVMLLRVLQEGEVER